jgi:hypothetical protein
MGTILVSGALANKPRNGGEAWVRLSWIEGFRQLGHDVHFVEQIAGGASFDESLHLAWFREVTTAFGLADRAALICDDGRTIYGSTVAELQSLAADADLLVNISGNLAWQPMLSRLRRTAYVDIDPGFTQFWHVQGVARIPQHDLYFTIAANLGRSDCSIPTCGLPWKTTRPPVVLSQWPVVRGDPDCFTTIASWRGPFGPIEHDGKRLGVKAHEFRKVMSLPAKVRQRLEIALSIDAGDEADRQKLLVNGWRLVAPADVAATPQVFQQYVQQSGGEFSAAQGMYVDTNSGWFSDRTVRYLASGKPVLVQETGFSRELPTGRGLLTFASEAEAVVAAAAIAADYDAHCVAARAIAAQYFAHDVVLPRFLDDAGGVQ